MPSLRHATRRTLKYSWALARLQSLANLGRKPLLILAYHRVLERPPEIESYAYDLGLISATPEEFRWQMKYLATHFHPITMEQLDEYLRGHCSLPKRPVLVTFDDGFLDNYVNAYPILRETGVPATFFLATSYIGTTRMFWYQQACFIASRCKAGSIQLPDGTESLPTVDSWPARHEAAAMLLRHLKSLPQDDLYSFLEDLRTRLSIDLGQPELDTTAVMTWDHVREMSRGGMSFGSHTVDHSVLSRLQGAALVHQLRESREVIEREIGKTVTSIAYPVGRRYTYNAEVIRATATSGYRIAVSYEPGINWTRAMNPFELRRQNIEMTTRRSHFRSLVEAPSFFI